MVCGLRSGWSGAAQPTRLQGGLHCCKCPTCAPEKFVNISTLKVLSDITLIRTDTTLDLSQKAEKGKSPLRRPESRFSGPQAMTLSRQFYDPGEGAAAGASLGSPRPPRPSFRPCIPQRGCPGGFLLVRGSLAAPGVELARAAPARAGLRRATRLAAPARLAASAWPRACFLLCGPLRLRREV